MEREKKGKGSSRQEAVSHACRTGAQYPWVHTHNYSGKLVL